MKKDSKTSSRIEELKQIYAPLSSEKMALAYPLIENMVFIEQQMESLQQIIASEGFTDEYQNGNNQFGKKQSANLQSYNGLVKSYNMISSRLEGMLPKQQNKSKLEAMMNE